MKLLGTHFGTYEVGDDAEASPTLWPFRHDPSPSTIGLGFSELTGHRLRVQNPAIRLGWLEGHGGAKRGNDRFVEVSWDVALDCLAGELKRVRQEHGNRSIYAGSYGWASAGRFHHAQSQLKRFLNLIGGFTSSVNTYSFGAGAVMLPHIFGPAFRDTYAVATSWHEICQSTDVILSFGGMRKSNSEVESGGCGEHIAQGWLSRFAAKGGRFVMFSPTRSDVPEEVDGQWMPTRPNTDCAVLLALSTEIILAGRADEKFLGTHTHGYEQLRDYLLGKRDGVVKDADWASAISTIPAETIRDLAATCVERRSLINVSWSVQRADNGEMAYWAAVALASIAGQVGLPGGGICFGLMAVNSIGRPTRKLRGPAVPQGTNAVKDFIPVARISDLLLREKDTLRYDGKTLPLPDIKLVYWAGGNPFHHHQDINRLRKAFRKPDTVVVHESVWTATAMHADIVLPVTIPPERDDLAVSPRDHWVVASKRLTEPYGQALSDHAILARLSERFSLRDAFTDGLSESDWLRRLYDGFRAENPELPSFEVFWHEGHASLPDEALAFNTFDQLHAERRVPLETPSGRIELYSDIIAGFDIADFAPHAAWVEPSEWLGSGLASRWPLHLISPQPATRLHSQLDMVGDSRMSKVRGYEPVSISPTDAAARGIQTGDIVRLFNDRGSCLAAALIDDALMPGVVSLPTGSWYCPSDPSAELPLDLGGNPNTLTHDRGTSALSCGPSANSCLIEVERFSGDAVEHVYPGPSFAPLPASALALRTSASKD